MESRDDAQSRFKPWMVAVAIGLVAVIGGTTVFLMGSASKRRDGNDIVAYEASTQPVITALDEALAALVRLEPKLGTASEADLRSLASRHRGPLEAGRSFLVDLRVPDILRHITADQLNALNRTLGAVSQLDKIVAGADARGEAGAQFREALGLARGHQVAAATSMRDLQCLAGLECERAT